MKKIAILLLLAFHLEAQTQALNQLVYQIRNPTTRPAEFRSALEKIGEYLALDVLEEMSTGEMQVRTLTGAEATHALVAEEPVLITILRAGLPMNQGVQRVFPNADVGFFVMSRDEETLKAKIDYISLPDIEGRTVIISDTMLATGGSTLDAIKVVERYGPKRIFVLTAIAAEPGISRILEHNPSVEILPAAIDPILNERGYIVPGLGDAGDRSFGLKCHTMEESWK